MNHQLDHLFLAETNQFLMREIDGQVEWEEKILIYCSDLKELVKAAEKNEE